AETGLAVVVLLGDDAVEPDQPPAEVIERGLPDSQSEAVAAAVRPDDVEADESEVVPVPDGGYGRDGFAAVKPHQEAARVGGAIALGIMNSRVPSLPRGPLDGGRDFLRPHGPDGVVVIGHRVPPAVPWPWRARPRAGVRCPPRRERTSPPLRRYRPRH